MYNKLTIPSVLTLDMIPVLRADGHDPVEILYTIAQNSSWDKKEILEVFKRLGSGHSAWIQLAYLLSADSTETKDAVI